MLALIFTRKLRPMIIGSRLRVVPVGGDDGPPARDLVAHELGRDALAQRDEAHLLGDLAPARVVHLAEVARRRARCADRSTAGAAWAAPRAGRSPAGRPCRRRRAAARRPRPRCGGPARRRSPSVSEHALGRGQLRQRRQTFDRIASMVGSPRRPFRGLLPPAPAPHSLSFISPRFPSPALPGSGSGVAPPRIGTAPLSLRAKNPVSSPSFCGRDAKLASPGRNCKGCPPGNPRGRVQLQR